MRLGFNVVLRAVAILTIMVAACAPSAPAPNQPPPQATTAPAQPAATSSAPQASPAVAPASTAAAGAKPSGAPIKIGLVTGTSGAYASLGSDQARGGELAVKQINAEGGILGRPVELLVRDDKLNPQEAAKQAEDLVANDNVVMLTGAVSGAASGATNSVAKRAEIPYLRPAQSLNDIKGDMGPYTFYFGLAPWVNLTVAMPWITENLGKKFFILAADYSWGLDNMAAAEAWLQANNLTDYRTAKMPLGTTDFSPILTQIQAFNPDVVLVANAGADQIAFVKQARSFGLFEQTKIFNTVIDLPFDQELGFQNVEGHYGGMNFYWELQDQLPSAKAFVDAFAQEFGNPPSGYAAYQYVAIRAYADAAEKAGSIEPAKVAAALEDMSFDYAVGKSFIRKCDHQLFQPVHIAVGRSEAEAKDVKPWPQFGFRELVVSVEATEGDNRSCEELGVQG